MRLAIGLAVLSILALTACQSQEIDYDKIGESVAEAIGQSRLEVSFFGTNAKMIELDEGEYNVYAVAAKDDNTAEIQVKIKSLDGLWTELISAKSEGDEEVLVGTGNLKIEESGLYILYGYADDAIRNWWRINLIPQ